MPREKADIRCNVIRVIKEEIDQRGGKHQLRLVDWIVDGKATGVKLERRDFWESENGEEKLGKAKGLSYNDLSKIFEIWPEVQAIMTGQKAPRKADDDEFPL